MMTPGWPIRKTHALILTACLVAVSMSLLLIHSHGSGSPDCQLCHVRHMPEIEPVDRFDSSLVFSVEWGVSNTEHRHGSAAFFPNGRGRAPPSASSTPLSY